MQSKYNVGSDKTKRTFNNIVFASVLEMKYYKEIALPMLENGEIKECLLQEAYELQPMFIHNGKKIRPIQYVADFVLVYPDNRKVVIDTKGFADSVALMKKKMFLYHYPDIEYRWICYSKIDGGWCDYEYVKAQRKIRKALKKGKNKGE